VHFGIFEGLQESSRFDEWSSPMRSSVHALDRVEFIVQGDRDVEVLDAARRRRSPPQRMIVTVIESKDAAHVHARETHLVPGCVDAMSSMVQT